MSTHRISSILFGSLIAASAFAGAPDLQTWSNTGVVRIVVNNNRFNGSGTIIANKVDEFGFGWLCILTADHVVSTTGAAAGATYGTIGIDTGNGANANLVATPLANASFVARKAGAAVDLAVLGVRYGVFDAAYNASVREVFTYGSGERDITSIGYGSSGTYVPQKGYARTPNSWQTQRYVNNKAETFAVRTPFGGYTFDAMEWDVDAPSTGTSVVGEGTILDGDSGGAVFFSEPTMDNRFNPAPMVFGNKLIGVNSYAQIDYADPEYTGGLVRWGYINGAVKITPAYKAWIDQQCMTVPEPTSMTALGLGAIALLRRRKKTS